jgi:hypothetical protein
MPPLLPILYPYLEGGKMDDKERKAIAKLLDLLEEEPPPGGPAPRVVRELAQRFPGTNLRRLAQRALEKARAQTMEAIEALREDLGLSSSHSEWESFTQEIRQTLAVGGCVEVKCPFVEVGSAERRAVFWFCKKRTTESKLWEQRHFSLLAPLPSEDFEVAAQAGRVEVWSADRLMARRERAFLHANGLGGVKKALHEVQKLPSLFSALGLSDLEEALSALSELEEGEVKVVGPYTLTREGNVRILRRGSLFGDPDTDALFLRGKPVTLVFSSDLHITLKLRGLFGWKGRVSLEDLTIRWMGEVARFDGEEVWRYGTNKNLLQALVRETLKRWLERPLSSPRMRVLIEELAQYEDFLEASKGEEFLRRVHLRALSNF